MLTAVKERQKLDHAMLRPSAELQAYLESPLQLTDDVGWWGVCFGFLIQFNLFTCGCGPLLCMAGILVPFSNELITGVRRGLVGPLIYMAELSQHHLI